MNKCKPVKKIYKEMYKMFNTTLILYDKYLLKLRKKREKRKISGRKQ